MKNLRAFILGFAFVSLTALQAQDASLKLQYTFNLKAGSDSILDETGNGFNAKLNGSAAVKTLGAYKMLQILTYADQANTAANSLTISGLTAVLANLTLPATASNGATIAWSSSNTAVISNAGVVTRPALGASSVNITLTASRYHHSHYTV